MWAELIRVYVYWSQVEPEPGRYVFEAVDAFLDQLDGSAEVWVTVSTSSRWATREATDFLPPSPAKDLAAQLAGVEEVARVVVPGRPELFVFEVARRGRGPLLVVWEQRDAFTGEDQPPVAFDWPWPAAQAHAVDALGQAQPAAVRDGRVELAVSLTPVFVAAHRLGLGADDGPTVTVP